MKRQALESAIHGAVLGILLPAAMIVLAGSSHAGATWVVNPGGGGDATTIAGGVVLASQGDTIRIAAGTYPEMIAIQKGISFIGFGGEVIWQGDGTASCLSIMNAHTLRIQGIIFDGGGGDKGGGVYLESITGGVTIVSCTFRNMTVTDRGGGVYAAYVVPLTVQQCVFSQLEVSAGQRQGAGIYCNSDGVTILDSSFDNCVCTRGGALSLGPSGHLIERCTFSNCQANYAGALNLYGSNETTVRNCTFTGNHANYAGGAIELNGTGHVIENNIFRENTASTDGGAINAFSGSSNTIDGNLFVNNTGSVGGAIGNNDGLGDITGNSFYGNTAGNGAAIGIYAGTPTIERNIFSNQTGFAIKCSSSSTPIMCNDFWQNSGGDGNGCTIAPEDGNITLDPLFCDSAAGDFRLHADSPCAAENAPAGCLGIGAYPVACSSTPIRQTTWGHVRTLFR